MYQYFLRRRVSGFQVCGEIQITPRYQGEIQMTTPAGTVGRPRIIKPWPREGEGEPPPEESQ